MTPSTPGPDPVRLEVFQHLLAATAEQMGTTLMRSAFSANIKERRDFSCAIFDAAGSMVAQAAHLPVHLGSTPLCVQAAMDAIDMAPGDTVILNDPFRGGTHLPDITFVTPVFIGSRRTPDFYCANRAHHADVGGAWPGSMAASVDVHGEGLRIPPLRLIRAGNVDMDILDLLLANMRGRREREGDLLAQWSANRVGEGALRALVEEHGRAEVLARCGQLMDWTHALVGTWLRTLPQGVWTCEDFLEEPAPGGDGLAAIRLRLERTRRTLCFDFTGTDDAVAGPVNATRAVTESAVFYCLRLMLPARTPANGGVLRGIEIKTRAGSLVDARYPSPVAGGNVETSQRLVDVILGALARALPGRLPAASAGTMSNLTFGGEGFAYYETIAGGAGAGPGAPGAHAVHTHMTNTRNTPVEAMETEYPVRVLVTTVRRGSGGRGRWRGGDGIRRRLRFLEPVRLAWLAERQETGPSGLEGGLAGRPGSARVHRPDVRRDRLLSGRAAEDLPAGSEVEIQTPGGGGYGAP
jgi:N-methylhydantoinase B